MTEFTSRGILNPRAASGRFSLERHAPAADLEPLVERYWVIHWDLRGLSPHNQETLSYPAVNMVLGTHQPGVHGVCTRRFSAELSGLGWVVGIKFRPGTFRCLLGRDVSSLTDRTLTVREVFGREGLELDQAVQQAGSDALRVELVEVFLRGRRPEVTPEAAKAQRIVALAEADGSLRRVADLAERTGTGLRTMERLFRAHVGVTPKWVLRRFRVQEAAERVKAGAPADWAGLAQELGYFDQSHLIRDFRAQVGLTPAEYAARCAQGAGPKGD